MKNWAIRSHLSWPVFPCVAEFFWAEQGVPTSITMAFHPWVRKTSCPPIFWTGPPILFFPHYFLSYNFFSWPVFTNSPQFSQKNYVILMKLRAGLPFFGSGHAIIIAWSGSLSSPGQHAKLVWIIRSLNNQNFSVNVKPISLMLIFMYYFFSFIFFLAGYTATKGYHCISTLPLFME